MKFFHAVYFVFFYVWEIVRSTASLTRLVLGPIRKLHPRFVKVPLDLRGDFSQFLFACLVSMTPGSLSVSLDRRRSLLLVHLLDARDPDLAISQLKSRIEAPLLRIFGH
jgi:multicomponent K+:H+ antiporter subunit E